MVYNWPPSGLEWVANVVTFLNPRFTLPVWFLNELDSLFCFEKKKKNNVIRMAKMLMANSIRILLDLNCLFCVPYNRV